MDGTGHPVRILQAGDQIMMSRPGGEAAGSAAESAVFRGAFVSAVSESENTQDKAIRRCPPTVSLSEAWQEAEIARSMAHRPPSGRGTHAYPSCPGDTGGGRGVFCKQRITDAERRCIGVPEQGEIRHPVLFKT